MKNRDKFNDSIDATKELIIDKQLAAVKRIVKCLFVDFKKTFAPIEPCEYMLTYGAMSRALIAIESCVKLIQQGYVGSANAILRQILEHLMWAKLGLCANEDSLVKLNGYFYDYSLGKAHYVTDILKQTKIKSDKTYSAADIQRECKKIYHNFSFLTHACAFAQQSPFKVDDFYKRLYSCLRQVSILLDTFLIVFERYCIKASNYLSDNLIDEKQQNLPQALFIVHSVMPRIPKYRRGIESQQGNVSTYLQIAFESEWMINGERI